MTDDDRGKGAVEIVALLFKTILLRPYVFAFLAAFLLCSWRLLGWTRTWLFFFNTWLTALLCELSSTRNGFPFGWYFYNGSTEGEELYLWNVPVMDPLSFPFLLFASYCLALWFLLPAHASPSSDGSAGVPALRFDSPTRRSWRVIGLTAFFFALIDVVIDPVALRGDRWFLGKIYFYPESGIHFGVPLSNYLGWAVVALISLAVYRVIDAQLPAAATFSTASLQTTGNVLLGCGLYYGVLVFNLAVTFWIGEGLLGTTGLLMYLPITVLAILRFHGRLAPVIVDR
ncbi:membrane protein [Nitrospira sp.]|nr:membrane protein [Nitrospira sp.]